MKFNIILLLSVAGMMNSFASGDIPGDLSFYRQISMAIYDEYLSKKILPNKFEEIETTRPARNDDKMIEMINRLTVVPNTPAIHSMYLNTKRMDRTRLFAISRDRTFRQDTPRNGPTTRHVGRYLMLIKEDFSECDTRWVPEEEAQIILKQLDGFNPAKQPFAFQDFRENEDRQLSREQTTEFPTSSGMAENKRGKVQIHIPENELKHIPTYYRFLWLLGSLFVLLASWSIWLITKRRTKNY